ncbi:MAG: Hsp20/alpha crystallin family protein [Candidatus Bathyarchaeia archaeon]|jgi:HSP20 family protein
MWRRKKTILDEFEEIERRVDEFFDRVFSVEPMWNLQAHSLRPLYQVRETKDSIRVVVDLPYVEKEAINLRVDEQSIDLSAELRQPIRYERWGTAQRECEFRKLSVTIPLPAEIISDEAVAKFKEGVLTVELPRKMKKRIIRVE